MKVLICSTQLGSDKGGIATASRSYLNVMRRYGLDVEAITTHSPQHNKIANSLIFLGALLKVLGHLLSARIISRQPVCLYLQCGPAGSLVRKTILALFGIIFGANVVTHYHSTAFADYLAQRRLYARLLQALGKLSCRNLVLSEWWKDLFVASGMHSVFTVPNCIDAPDGTSRVEGENAQTKKTRLSTIARLVPGKNVELVVDAMRFLPQDYVLAIGGDGPLREGIENRIKSGGLEERVNMLGWIHSEEKHSLLRSTDLFVLPSEHDSFGIVFLEALSYGIPVLAANIPPVTTVLRDCIGVSFVELSNAEALAKEIMKAAAIKYDGAAISRSVLSQYGVNVIGEQLISHLHCSRKPEAQTSE